MPLLWSNRGGSFDRRLQARLAEMESDDKDRQRELEEIEEVRKRLGEKALVLEVLEEATCQASK